MSLPQGVRTQLTLKTKLSSLCMFFSRVLAMISLMYLNLVFKPFAENILIEYHIRIEYHL